MHVIAKVEIEFVLDATDDPVGHLRPALEALRNRFSEAANAHYHILDIRTIQMHDAVFQSSVNTLRIWFVRKQTQGRTVSDADLRKQISDRWPTIQDDEAARIIAAVKETPITR